MAPRSRLPKSSFVDTAIPSNARSHEEIAVKYLGERIADNSTRTFADVLEYIETTKKTQELHCPVCLEPWKHPAKAQCGHVFCEKCLRSWELKCRRSHLPVNCPCCRAEVKIVERQPPPPPPAAAKRKRSLQHEPQRCWLKLSRRDTRRLVGTVIGVVVLILILGLTALAHSKAFLPDDMTPAQRQQWVDARATGHQVLPTVKELANRSGAGLYAMVKTSIAVFPHELSMLMPVQELLRLGLEPSAYFPVGTIFKLTGYVKDGIFINSTVVEINCSLTDVVVPELPATFVQVMYPNMLYSFPNHSETRRYSELEPSQVAKLVSFAKQRSAETVSDPGETSMSDMLSTSSGRANLAGFFASAAPSNKDVVGRASRPMVTQ